MLSKNAFEQMHTQVLLANNEPIKYGYGIDIYPLVGLASYSHQGMVPGFFTWHVHFPNENITATAFTNLDKNHPGPALLDMLALQLNLSPKPVRGTKANDTIKQLVGRYLGEDQTELEISFDGNTLYSQYSGEEKRVIVPRENNAYSYECTENYFQLKQRNGKKELVPFHLYFGEQAPFTKL